LVGKDMGLNEYKNMVVDQWGNKYVIGGYKGNVSIGGYMLTSNLSNHWEARAVYLAKYNRSNELDWIKRVAQGDTLFMPSIVLNGKGLPYLSYQFYGRLKLQNATLNSFGLSDMVICELDTSGNMNNAFQIGSSQAEGGSIKNNMVFDGLGGYYFCGTFNSMVNKVDTLFIGSDTLVSDSLGNSDIFIVKFDSLNNPVWARKYGGNGLDGAQITYSRNRIYLLGVVGHFLNNNIGGLTFSTPQSYLRRGFVAQLDTAGNGMWARHFGSGSPDLLSSLSPVDLSAHGDNVSFTALDFSNIQNVFYFEGGPTLTGSDQRDYVIATYDTLGNFKWNRISKSSGSEVLTAVVHDSLNNLYGLGYHNFRLDFPTDSLYGMGGSDIHVVSYDSNGTYRFAFSAGGAGGDISSDIKITKQGEIYIVGGTTSNPCYMGNDTLYPPIGQSTIFYARIDSIDSIPNVSTSLQDFTRQDWSIYPNPVFDIMNIQVATDKVNNLEQVAIYDMLGRQIKIQNLTTQVRSDYIPINISALSEGVYIVTIKTKEATSSRKIIKR